MKDEDEKIKIQALTILSRLNIYNPCEIKTKYINSLDKVSIPILKYILTQNFIKGADMKAVLCLFDTLFLSLSVQKYDGVYVLTKEIKEYITDLYVLTNGADGTVYNATFFSDIELVIKLANNEEDEEDEEDEVVVEKRNREMMIREYYIGIEGMNKLRYIVPNFVYTLGCFMCGKPSKSDPLDKLCESSSEKIIPFIVYEKIPGKTVEDLIDNTEIPFKFEQWLVIFFQLLLALEVAQREVEFTHFDLHYKNVMVRKQDKFNYSVPLDMSTYTITNPEFIPVIIDFGRSTCTIDSQTVGTYAKESVGVLNHMVPGQDMYMFISYCCDKITDIDFKKKIVSLITDFYGTDHPVIYSIKTGSTINTRTKELKEFVSRPTSVGDTFQKVPVTAIGHYTPLMFMKSLLDKYPDILKPYITMTERKMYRSIQYSIMIKKYNDIFNYVEKGIDKATSLLISSSTVKKPSYIITKYICALLERYNKDLESEKLNRKIKEVNVFLLENKQELINFDIDMLEKVFDIKIPSQEELDKCISDILILNIYLPIETIRFVLNKKSYDFDKKPIKDASQKLNSVLLYEDQLKKYLQFYFTILELKLDHVFNDWIERFKSSEIYDFYTHNYLQSERARRWSKTLLVSSKNNKLIKKH